MNRQKDRKKKTERQNDRKIERQKGRNIEMQKDLYYKLEWKHTSLCSNNN